VGVQNKQPVALQLLEFQLLKNDTGVSNQGPIVLRQRVEVQWFSNLTGVSAEEIFQRKMNGIRRLMDTVSRFHISAVRGSILDVKKP
jgi:uncharacterized Fe-S cluster-containing radical SAM superfamily protein